MTGRLRTGGLAAWTLAFGLIAAIVCWFAIPDSRWIAGLIVAVTLFDLFVITLVIPRITEAPAGSEIDRLNAEAERETDDQA